MSTFTPNTVASGNVILASDHNTLGSLLTAVLNGNIDATNLADSAVTTAKIVDASVTNAKLATTAGELGGAYTTWAPTWTNITVGNGTVVARYTKVGKTITAEVTLVFGTTTSITGIFPTVTLPVTAGTTVQYAGISIHSYLDAGTTLYYGQYPITSGATTAALTVTNTGATYASESGLNTTVPFTWTTGDKITSFFSYEAA